MGNFQDQQWPVQCKILSYMNLSWFLMCKEMKSLRCKWPIQCPTRFLHSCSCEFHWQSRSSMCLLQWVKRGIRLVWALGGRPGLGLLWSWISKLGLRWGSLFGEWWWCLCFGSRIFKGGCYWFGLGLCRFGKWSLRIFDGWLRLIRISWGWLLGF